MRDDATFSLRPASAREFLSRGPIALGFALLLNQKMHGQSLIRVLIFVPYVISEVIVRTGWSLMLQTNGAVNGLLRSIGLLNGHRKERAVYRGLTALAQGVRGVASPSPRSHPTVRRSRFT